MEKEQLAGDEALQLAYADWLTTGGDCVGELIVLDHMDRALPGGLREVTALRRLLVLAARHGFPRFEDPDADVGQFAPCGWGYQLVEDGLEHVLAFHANGTLVDVEGRGVFEQTLFRRSEPPTDEETNVILHELGRAIRARVRLRDVVLPTGDALRGHPRYRLGPYPHHGLPLELGDGQGLGARDWHRWIALHRRYTSDCGSRMLV